MAPENGFDRRGFVLVAAAEAAAALLLGCLAAVGLGARETREARQRWEPARLALRRDLAQDLREGTWLSPCREALLTPGQVRRDEACLHLLEGGYLHRFGDRGRAMESADGRLQTRLATAREAARWCRVLESYLWQHRTHPGLGPDILQLYRGALGAGGAGGGEVDRDAEPGSLVVSIRHLPLEEQNTLIQLFHVHAARGLTWAASFYVEPEAAPLTRRHLVRAVRHAPEGHPEGAWERQPSPGPHRG